MKRFSQETKSKLANLIKKKVYAPNEIIFDP